MLTAVIGVCLRPALQAVIGNIKEEIEKAPLPIVHYGLDLWTCTCSGRNVIHVHVFLVDGNFILRHALLAVSYDTLNFVPSLVGSLPIGQVVLVQGRNGDAHVRNYK